MKGLSAERWQRIDAVFAAALERPPDERARFLDEACGGDPALRAEVDALLRSAAEAERDLGDSAAAFASPLIDELRGGGDGDALPAGRMVGPYRIVREIGRGGMGAVYLAGRADGNFDRQVALKLVKRGMDTDEVLDRFRRERRILASLEHPHIARLYEGGADEDGRPYLAMEYVEGEPVTAWCDARRLGIDARLRLFERVCEAVQHAHRNLVIHRDLKPSNILVTEQGEPRLLDFGIAKLLDEEPFGAAPRTRTGVRVLTPEYAAPEQVAGEAATTATDVYGLGVVLHELLTGRRPASRDDDAADAGPESPSRAALRGNGGQGEAGDEPARVAAARGTTPERLRRRLRGDLDTILLKALSPRPERRYGSVEQLVEDLRRYRRGLPVVARRDTFGYRAAKFARRHRAAVVAFVLVLGSLAGGLGAALWQAERAQRERDAARAERARAEQMQGFLLSLFNASDPVAGRPPGADTLRVRHLLDRAAQRVHRELAGEPRLRAQMLGTLGRVYTNLGLYEQADTLLKAALALQQGGAETARDRAATLALAAALHKATGAYAAADSALGRVLALYRTHAWRPDSLSVASTSERGVVLGYLSRHDEAESFHRAALDGMRRLGGEGTPLHGMVLNNFAIHHYDLGDYGEAERLLRASIGILRAQPEVHSPALASRLNNLASTLHYLGRLDEAEPLYREAVSLARVAYGEVHPETGLFLQNLATLYDDRRDYARAESLYRESLRVHEAVFGRRSANTAMLLRNLALNRHEAGDYATAERLLREARASLEAELGPDHVYPALAAVSLGRTLTALGRAGDAVPLITEQLRVLERQLPAEHWMLAAARRDLGAAYLALGRHARAEPLLLQGLAELRRARGDDSYLAAEARAHLVRLYTERGEPEKAEAYRGP